jgi:hypothetical protein
MARNRESSAIRSRRRCPGLQVHPKSERVIVARCTRYGVGFVVRKESAERVRFAMGAHQDWEHESHMNRAAFRPPSHGSCA